MWVAARGETRRRGGIGASLTGAVIAEEINSTAHTHTNTHSESYSGNPTLDGTQGGQVESHQLARAPKVTSFSPVSFLSLALSLLQAQSIRMPSKTQHKSIGVFKAPISCVKACFAPVLAIQRLRVTLQAPHQGRKGSLNRLCFSSHHFRMTDTHTTIATDPATPTLTYSAHHSYWESTGIMF